MGSFVATGAGLNFSKMHGAGNDFVVIDRRGAREPFERAQARAMADRHTGVGFDQLLSIESTTRADCIAAYAIYNADGSSAEQCGNGVRCIVAWLARTGALRSAELRLQSPTGTVDCRLLDDGQVRVVMGVPEFEPERIPFVATADIPLHTLEVLGRTLKLGVANMGNPHAVLEVDAVATASVLELGPAIERHARFPQRCNVGFAAVRAPDAIDLRVFERGVGETLACGSGACAAVAVLARRGRVGARVAVTLPGGTLIVEWAGPGQPVAMTGPAAFVFEGIWKP